MTFCRSRRLSPMVTYLLLVALATPWRRSAHDAPDTLQGWLLDARRASTTITLAKPRVGGARGIGTLTGSTCVPLFSLFLVVVRTATNSFLQWHNNHHRCAFNVTSYARTAYSTIWRYLVSKFNPSTACEPSTHCWQGSLGEDRVCNTPSLPQQAPAASAAVRTAGSSYY